jgi:ABC-2 type transport system ATP-binding protein
LASSSSSPYIPPMAHTAIEVDHLTKRFDKVLAVADIAFSVAAGTTVALLGGNGAGKTTTIKILMRLMYPTAGSARLCGVDVDDVAMHARIGYLPEQPYFYDYLTARELVEYCGELCGLGRAQRRARAAELLERVRLDRAAWDRQLRRFSKGMLQRVGLAQALVNEPELVVLDEPMSGLDPIGRRQVRDLIGGLRARGTTVFFSSHIVADIEVLCDRVAILRGGRVAHLGRLDDLRQRVDSAGHLEITVTGGTADRLRELVAKMDGAHVEATPGGMRIEVADEQDVDAALAAVRQCGGRLVSVQPVRQSLEDLFVSEGPRATHTD